MHEILAGIIEDFSNFKVLIVKMFSLEYFDLSEKAVINDSNLFLLMKIIGTRTMGNLNGVGISSANMLAHNVVDGSLTKICKIYQ